MSISILWYPKSWKLIIENPRLIFMTSNRMRVYNFHECIKNYDHVDSEVFSFTVKDVDPFSFDIIILQKNIPDNSLVKKLSKAPNKLVVFDICDPVNKEFLKKAHKYANLLITASPSFNQNATMRCVHLKLEYKTADGSGRDATATNYTQIAEFGRSWGHDGEGFATPCIQTIWDHNLAVGTVKNIAVTATGAGTNGAGLFYNNNGGVGRSNMTIFEVLGTVAA